jgi:beta-N-acetylhexosaminidase
MLADMPAAMTAHVVYADLDPSSPATTSRKVIRNVIRGTIGYDGLLMSDDLSMQALAGTLAERAANAFAGGCDIGLHCNGVMEEMIGVAGAAPRLSGKARRRADNALARIRHLPEPVDVTEARERLAAALATETVA